MARQPTAGDPSLDRWTIAAIAIVVYVVSALAHEAAGHGAMCLLTGCRAEMLNFHFFEWDDTGVSSAVSRWIAAGGPLANGVLACVAWSALRRDRMRPEWRLALALLLAVNLLQLFGYLGLTGLVGIGDWAQVFEGIRPEWLWRIALTLLSGLLYFVAAPRLSRPGFEPFLGQERSARRARVSAVTLLPYLVGGASDVAAGMLSPQRAHTVAAWLLSLVRSASLGATVLLAFYPLLWARNVGGGSAGPPLGIPRNVAWCVTAAIVLVFYVAVLGPGIRLGLHS